MDARPERRQLTCYGQSLTYVVRSKSCCFFATRYEKDRPELRPAGTTPCRLAWYHTQCTTSTQYDYLGTYHNHHCSYHYPPPPRQQPAARRFVRLLAPDSASATVPIQVRSTISSGEFVQSENLRDALGSTPFGLPTSTSGLTHHTSAQLSPQRRGGRAVPSDKHTLAALNLLFSAVLFQPAFVVVSAPMLSWSALSSPPRDRTLARRLDLHPLGPCVHASSHDVRLTWILSTGFLEGDTVCSATCLLCNYTTTAPPLGVVALAAACTARWTLLHIVSWALLCIYATVALAIGLGPIQNTQNSLLCGLATAWRLKNLATFRQGAKHLCCVMACRELFPSVSPGRVQNVGRVPTHCVELRPDQNSNIRDGLVPG